MVEITDYVQAACLIRNGLSLENIQAMSPEERNLWVFAFAAFDGMSFDVKSGEWRENPNAREELVLAHGSGLARFTMKNFAPR